MAFADHYPLASFAAIADACWWRNSGVTRLDAATPEARAEASRMDAVDNARLEAHQADVLLPAIMAHLADLRTAGRLAPATGLAGRDVWQANAWNRLVADAGPAKPGRRGQDVEQGWLLGLIGQAFTRRFVRMDGTRHAAGHVPGTHKPPSAKQAATAWKALCADYDGGDSGSRFDGWAIECNDRLTGDRCELQFHGWAAKLMVQNARYELEPATDVVPLGLSAVDLALPTGDLLVTDALRIAGMEEGTDLGKAEYGTASLESATGRMRRTQIHAERHGMGFCQTENTSVRVFRSHDGYRVAFMACGQRPMRGWTDIGTVSCDVWRVIALDRATAISLATAGGNADAEADITRYLALASAPDAWTGEGDWQAHRQAHHDQTYARNIVRASVEPGTWTFHSGPDFQTKADKKSLGLPKSSKPWAVMVRKAD